MPYILTDIVSGMLLRNGIATLHCSAVNHNGRSIIIFAPPDTGKTLTCMRLVKNHGYKFVAEDFALTDGESLWAVPWTSTFRFYDDINQSKMDSFLNTITKLLPVLALFKFTKSKSIDHYIDQARIELYSEATDVAVLERGESAVCFDKEEGLRKILNLNKYEFNYHKAPAVIAMNYFNRDFCPDDMYTHEKEILYRLITKCKYYCISERNALRYSDVLAEMLCGN